VIDWTKASIAMKKALKIKENYEGTALFCDLSREGLLSAANANRTGKKPLLPAGKACLLLAAASYDDLLGSV